MRVIRILAPLALAGLLAAGCAEQDGNGTASPSAPAASSAADNGVANLAPDEILKKAAAALDKAGSYRIKGEVTSDGEKMSMDVKTKGKDVIGAVSLGGANIQLLSVGDEKFLKADTAFWKQNAGAAGDTIAKTLGTKWAKINADNQGFASFFSIADPNEVLKPDGTVTKGQTKTIAGVPAIALTDDSGDGTLYIATTGEPYPLMLEAPDNGGQIVFSDFGAAMDEIKKPAASEVMDLSKVMPAN